MLDEAQEQIASYLQGALLVLAPVGTGKTHVLTERVARALAHGFAPERLLCLTFTNRAAQELRQRLRARFPQLVDRLDVETFHSLCARILSVEARAVGLSAECSICDDEDSTDLLRELGPYQPEQARRFFFDLSRLKIDLRSPQLSWPLDWSRLFAPLGEARLLAERYQAELARQHKLDFADLELFTVAVLKAHPEIRARWAERFDLVQVDEVQDINLQEANLLWVVSRRTGNLALFGDLDQTIYEWRGSKPLDIRARFEQDFAPVAVRRLELNRRATRRLVLAADAFAETLERRKTTVQPAPDCAEGQALELHLASDADAEARWIAARLRALAESGNGFAYQRVGVLCRTHLRAARVSQAFDEAGLPHFTVEQFEFFRRQEIKDALARLRLLLNPADVGAALRLLERPPRGIGSGTIGRLRKAGEPAGLRLADLLRPETCAAGEPFGRLLDEFQHGRLVVLDVETTGTSPQLDEVIEIAATRLRRGRPAERFHALLRNTVPVGLSESVHRLSDAELAADGLPAADALLALFAFVGGDLVVGHNVGFDRRMLVAHARRLGLPAPSWETADTLLLARRFLDAADCGLGALARQLRLAHRPGHRAAADVAATSDLLAALAPRVAAGAASRRRLVAEHSALFAPLSQLLERWRLLAGRARPAELLQTILDESGLLDYYATRHADEPRRRAHLEELVRLFAQWDDGLDEPLAALEAATRRAALARQVDNLADGAERIPVLTIHQAKGLEFDTVVVAGLTDAELPLWRHAGDNLEEERRLFYVALTRARRQLILTSHAVDRGRHRRLSPFVRALPRSQLQQV